MPNFVIKKWKKRECNILTYAKFKSFREKNLPRRSQNLDREPKARNLLTAVMSSDRANCEAI